MRVIALVAPFFLSLPALSLPPEYVAIIEVRMADRVTEMTFARGRLGSFRKEVVQPDGDPRVIVSRPDGTGFGYVQEKGIIRLGRPPLGSGATGPFDGVAEMGGKPIDRYLETLADRQATGDVRMGKESGGEKIVAQLDPRTGLLRSHERTIGAEYSDRTSLLAVRPSPAGPLPLKWAMTMKRKDIPGITETYVLKDFRIGPPPTEWFQEPKLGPGSTLKDDVKGKLYRARADGSLVERTMPAPRNDWTPAAVFVGVALIVAGLGEWLRRRRRG